MIPAAAVEDFVLLRCSWTAPSSSPRDQLQDGMDDHRVQLWALLVPVPSEVQPTDHLKENRQNEATLLPAGPAHVVETHGAELLEGHPAVSVRVGADDAFIHHLLQLLVLQVGAHHHLQHLEELPVGDEAVFVHVVDPKGDWAQRQNRVREVQNRLLPGGRNIWTHSGASAACLL